MKISHSILQITKKDQVRVSEELIESSRLTGGFYLMLILSSMMVTLGLLLNNPAVIIGGMLITPLLTPLLTFALGIVICDIQLLWRSTKIFLRSIGIVFGVAVLLSFFFPLTEFNAEITSRLDSNIAYLIVAFVAGLAATFAWTNKNLSAMLPGVAIAVSLLPPLAVVGIGLAHMNIGIIRGSLLTFALNFFGIILGSVIIFSLLNFYRTKKETTKAVKEEIKEEEIKKEIKNGQKKIEVAEIKQEVKRAVKEEIKKEIEKEAEEEEEEKKE
ncbi:MAG: TIGR00341 family protein [Candidatus Magasanikbacteria bacterium CG10_big_fil_rev_8_21_14_0_10_36_32]|uniref:TIGR00341 family protein n=1 Tax=Candidatus Magasanikbacteria bacterium CG10_big_fil_rev_8_21_14_0_10_36_32 TaxID=1974646 RepID=A0A2M6W7Q8_9BACT|nr:MAG: TIGR00341 family protein [Candidatus Magasanikbacteria bacterium CG10_big_fil_rev_8_21_14_0_10_36_32]